MIITIVMIIQTHVAIEIQGEHVRIPPRGGSLCMSMTAAQVVRFWPPPAELDVARPPKLKKKPRLDKWKLGLGSLQGSLPFP